MRQSNVKCAFDRGPECDDLGEVIHRCGETKFLRGSSPRSAWKVDDILLTRTLRDQGFDDRELRRMRRDGTLLRVRRGAYVRERPAERTRDDQYRELVFATALQLHDAAVISHGSAAVLHGLPIWQTAIDRVHVTRNRNSGGNRRAVVHMHTALLTERDMTTIDGVTVTSLARTVLDLCRRSISPRHHSRPRVTRLRPLGLTTLHPQTTPR